MSAMRLTTLIAILCSLAAMALLRTREWNNLKFQISS
jgi:hypothetical protein